MIIFKRKYKVGRCSYLFLIYYGVFRVVSEFFREPDPQLGYFFNLMSMGTILSLLMILSGFIIRGIFRKKNEIWYKVFKKSKTIPVDEFFKNVLYDNKYGYYTSKLPFGEKGDFITSPKISNLFSEIIAIWIIATWEIFDKPKNFNIVELGPGDGSLINILLKSFKKFQEFNAAKKIFLYEKSNHLRKIQKKNISDKNVYWINDFKKIKKGQ